MLSQITSNFKNTRSANTAEEKMECETEFASPHLRREPLPTTLVSDNDNANVDEHHHGHASVSLTIANMSKTCMGTGCLALPFAAKQGGIVLHIAGIIGIAVWNTITVRLLCECYDLTIGEDEDISPINSSEETSDDPEKRFLMQSSGITTGSTLQSSYESIPNHLNIETEAAAGGKIDKHEPPKGMTTLTKLAWYAMGDMGASALDCVMIVYLVGVVVAYMNAMRSFLNDTVFSIEIEGVDTLLLIALMGPLSVAPHTGHLAKFSVMGLAVLGVTFMVVVWYGFSGVASPGVSADTGHVNNSSWHVLVKDSASDILENVTNLAGHESSPWLPRNGMAGASQWFGCVVFGFGVTPLTFNFREAMRDPRSLQSATRWAMLLVAVSYISIGVVLFCVYPHIQGDILHELPAGGWLPTLTRLAMVVVVLITAPLLVVPCGELIEKRLHSFCRPTQLYRRYTR